MGWLSALAPVAQIGLAASGVGLPIAMGGGALLGGLAAREKRQEALKLQGDTANAAADAIAASWARKKGQNIPPIQWAGGTNAGDLYAGAAGGAMQGYAFRNMPNLFGGGYDPNSQLENMYGQTSAEDALSGITDPADRAFSFNMLRRK